MTAPVRLSLLAAALVATQVGAQQATPAPAPVAEPAVPAKPVFAQGSMNVYRSVPADVRPAMVDFYQKAIGLRPLAPIQLNATTQMILFKAGDTGQIKIAAARGDGAANYSGGLNDGIGIRVFTLHFPDEAAVVARFRAAGVAAPAFRAIAGGRRGAMVKDPGGFPLALVIDPKAGSGVEVGINVADLARSRAFYREFAGLEELPAVKDPLLGVTKYPFRHGETTVSLWQAGSNLPKQTLNAGIQYVIGNIHAVDAAAKARNVHVQSALGGIAGFPVLTVWFNDPDGVVNYFYQSTRQRSATAAN